MMNLISDLILGSLLIGVSGYILLTIIRETLYDLWRREYLDVLEHGGRRKRRSSSGTASKKGIRSSRSAKNFTEPGRRFTRGRVS